MIELYTDSTPNGWKASVMLEEIELKYQCKHVDILKGDQKEEWFLKICPNGRIPAIIDKENNDLAIFESGAILLYLGEKTGKLLPQESRAKSQVVQWLMFQMGGIGPMMGQSNVFFRYFPEKLPAVIQRYQNECRRLFEVLDRQLENRDYLCGEYSIADIANWCWVRIHQWGGSDISSLDNLLGWINRMEQRPACKKGVCVPHEIDFSELERDLTNNDSAVRGLVTQ